MRNTVLTLIQLSTMTAFLGVLINLDRRHLRPRILGAIVLALCGVLSAYLFLISEPSIPFSDFHRAYYPAGAAVLESPQALTPFIEKGVNGFVNLPIVAYVFAPFALLPFNWAARLFFCLGVAATFLAWLLLAREARLNSLERWTLLILFSANGPLANSLKEGNTSHFVLFALVLAFGCLRKNWQMTAGAILGICALIKLPLLLFGPYFLLRGIWRSVLGFGLAIGLSGALSIIIFGFDLNLQWFQLCVLKFGSHPIGAFNVQSIPAFLMRLLAGPEILLDWGSTSASIGQRLTGTLLTALLILAAAWACLRYPLEKGARREWDDHQTLEYCLIVILAVVASPLSWSHYYAWLLFPIAFFLSDRYQIASSSLSRPIAWVAILLVSQAIVIISMPNPLMALIYTKLVVSSLLFGGLLWYAIFLTACTNRASESAVSREEEFSMR